MKTGIILSIVKRNTFMCFRKRFWIKKQLFTILMRQVSIQFLGKGLVNWYKFFQVRQNQRPLFIPQKLQLPLGLSIISYLFIYPWSSEMIEVCDFIDFLDLSELILNLSDLQKSETFVYFTKITAATWSINNIIPVFIALPAIISEFSCGDVASWEIRWSTCLRIEFWLKFSSISKPWKSNKILGFN